MQVFAYISIIDAVFKLLIAYVLVVFGFDRLILYSVLQFIVQVSIQLINRHYCRKRFIECEFKFKFHKSSFKEMASFACYDLYGNMSVTLRTQGVNILLNMFFGPILNAASSIASQVQGAILSFANNIVMAVRPQIVKSYSSKDYDRVIFLIHKSSVICFILLLMISMPIIVEAPYILRLWLGSYPEYTVMLCRLSLLFGLFANLSVIIMMGIHSTGRIKRPSFINGSLYLLVIPISYFSYRMGASPEVAFIFNVVAVCVGLISNAWTLHLYLPKFSFKTYLSSVLFKVVLIMILSSSILYAVSISLDENIFRLILVCFVSVILSIVSLLLVLSKHERKILLTKISSKIRI